MLRVLWLCSRYPNNLEANDADFVQRNAQATSMFNEVHVIKLTPDSKAKAVNKVTRKFQQWPNLTETFIYYPKPKSFIGKTVAFLRWYSLYKYAVENYIEKSGKPDLVHVHIPYKSGAIAGLIKRKYKIPYVVTEHWGGYNDVVENNYLERDFTFRSIIKETYKAASALHTASDFLGEQINRLVTKISFTVIPDAVDTNCFNHRPVENASRKFRLVHPSNGASEKNIAGIVEAFQRLDRDRFNFQIIGLPEEINGLLSRMYPFIDFTGKVSDKQVSDNLNNADALIIFSNMENSPCVIGEALCCGVPVIATNVGGISELVDSTNGLLLKPGDVDQLVEMIEYLVLNIKFYDKRQISESAVKKFSYKQIGFETDLWYKNVLLPSEGSKTPM